MLHPSAWLPGRDLPPPVVEAGDVAAARTRIVIYNTMWDRPPRWDGLTLPEGCALTTDRGSLPGAHAVVFHLPSLRRLPAEKPRGQLWVAWSMECAENVPRWRGPTRRARFDLRMDYGLDADVVTTYRGRWPVFLERLRTPPAPKTGLAVLFLSGRADHSGRVAWARELMRHLPVDSYGRRLRTRVLAEDRGPDTKLEVCASYRFTLALENAVARDYVTEKFWGPLAVGSVPVYLGAPNVAEHAPGDDCYLDVRDFPDPRALAARLHALARDEPAYEALLSWKQRPFRTRFVETMERSSKWVRLCEVVQQRQGLRR